MTTEPGYFNYITSSCHTTVTAAAPYILIYKK